MENNYENRRYLVIPTSIKEQIDFTQVLETSVDTLRLSVDEMKTFVKYNITIEDGVIYGRPSVYSEEYNEYTHDDFIQILSTSEWVSDENEII
jgi:hypothetical protein